MFSPESTKLALDILQNEIPFAIWETVYVTIISTFLALVVGLPLGVLLVVGEKDGILPLPKSILSVLNAVYSVSNSDDYGFSGYAVFRTYSCRDSTDYSTTCVCSIPIRS